MPRTARWRRRSTTDPVTGLARAGASSASGAVSTVSLMSSIMSVIMSLEMELSTTISTRSLFSSATSMAGVLVSLMVASLTSMASSLVLAAAGSCSRWYCGMRGITVLERERHSGHRNSDFSTSKDVGCRVRYLLLSDSDTSSKYFCQQVACITWPQDEVCGAEVRLEDRKGNVDEDTGAGAWPRTLDRTVDFWTYAAMTSVLQSAVRCSSSWQRMHTKLVSVMAAWLLLGPRHTG